MKRIQELFIAIVAAAGTIAGGAACASMHGDTASQRAMSGDHRASRSGSYDSSSKSAENTPKSSVNENLSPRAQRDAIIDALYAQYGGGDVAQKVRGSAENGNDSSYGTGAGASSGNGSANDYGRNQTGDVTNPDDNNNGTAEKIGEDARQLGHDLGQGAKDIGQGIKRGASNAVTTIDRTTFAAHCNTVGEGKEPTMIDETARSFFKQPDVVAKCREVARLNNVIFNSGTGTSLENGTEKDLDGNDKSDADDNKATTPGATTPGATTPNDNLPR